MSFSFSNLLYYLLEHKQLNLINTTVIIFVLVPYVHRVTSILLLTGIECSLLLTGLKGRELSQYLVMSTKMSGAWL